jgi:hypothetical protein
MSLVIWHLAWMLGDIQPRYLPLGVAFEYLPGLNVPRVQVHFGGF